MLLVLGGPVTAQERAALSAAERTRLERVIEGGLRQYREAAGESPGARENYAHVQRMLDAIASRRGELARRGIDADVARAGVLFSDLGKNPANLSGLAQELFPREFANPETRGQAMFRAFLLHEIPGRRLFREAAREAGLSRATVARVEAANVGHNGPAAEGSWWRGAWDGMIRSQASANFSGPHGSLARQYIGRAYPEVQGLEGALHTALDRRDQGTRDGSLKIMGERMGRGETLREAFRASFGTGPQANQGMTQVQFDALRQRFPSIFEIDIVQQAERAVRQTARYSNHVVFNRAGTRAQVRHADGRVADVRSFAGLQRELTRIESPSARRVPRDVSGPASLSRLTGLRVSQLVAEARRQGLNPRAPYDRASLIRSISGRPLSEVRTALSAQAPTVGIRGMLEGQVRESARRRPTRR
ncbi:MAG: hypothetical protein R3F62_02465 [Planctomycetota bacterium]